MKRGISALLCVLVLLTALPVTALAEVTEATEATYLCDGEAYALESGTVTLRDREGNTVNTVDSYYSDGFFMQDPTLYSPHIATLSMYLSQLSWYSRDSERFLRRLGFTVDYVSAPYRDNTGNRVDPAYLLAHKEIPGSEKVLVAVIPRNGSYGEEWGANLTLGVSGDAAGFAPHARIIADTLYRTLQETEVGGKKLSERELIFWLTSYSRGGAVVSLAAQRIIADDAFQIGSGNTLHAYTFGCPAVFAQGHDDPRYAVIHNVVNGGDFVTNVVPRTLGLTRYGQDHCLSDPGTPYATDSESFRQQLEYIEPGATFARDFSVNCLHLNLDALKNWRGLSRTGKVLALARLLRDNAALARDLAEGQLSADSLLAPSSAVRTAKEYQTDLGEYAVCRKITSRQVYAAEEVRCALYDSTAGEDVTCAGTIEAALADYITFFMKVPADKLEELGEVAADLGNQLGLADIDLNSLSTVDGLLTLLGDMINWQDLSESVKREDTAALWGYLDACRNQAGDGFRDVLTQTQYTTLRNGFPAILEVLLSMLSGDCLGQYAEGSVYDTSGEKGILLATLLRNTFIGVEDVMHNPLQVALVAPHVWCIYLAALRAEDPLYAKTPETEYVYDEAGHWTHSGVILTNYGAHTSTGDNCATCTRQAVCDVCGASYGEVTAHSFTEQVAAPLYLKTLANARHGAVYYTSCAVCGLSSQGQEGESTFTGGERVHGITAVVNHLTNVSRYARQLLLRLIKLRQR